MTLIDKMPQITKGGKFIFGWSRICENGQITIPQQVIDEYKLEDIDKIILISGSKKTGGFCITTKVLIENSNIKGLFKSFPLLSEYQTKEGEFVKYKGRLYCWITLHKDTISLSKDILTSLDLTTGGKLLSIRGSNTAFVMGVKGPLIDKANNSDKTIELF